VTEVACAGQDHGNSTLVGGGNDFVITHAAAGLNHAGGARFGNHIQTIAEGEESVGRDSRTLILVELGQRLA